MQLLRKGFKELKINAAVFKQLFKRNYPLLLFVDLILIFRCLHLKSQNFSICGVATQLVSIYTLPSSTLACLHHFARAVSY